MEGRRGTGEGRGGEGGGGGELLNRGANPEVKTQVSGGEA